MEGLGTDDNTLIQILCNRTVSQRVAISQAYKASYNKVLMPE